MAVTKHLVKRLIAKNSHGSVLVLIALLLIVFIGIAALAIDIGHLSTTKNELQNVADAAALAGAGYLGSVYEGLPPAQHGTHNFDKNEVVNAVKAVAAKNKASGVAIDIDANDVTVGMWDPGSLQITPPGTLTGPDAVSVIARRDASKNNPISTFFAKIFGIKELPVAAEATAALTGPGTLAEGELITPFGISERFFYPSLNCQDVISFSPTPSSCAGWHNFFDAKDASAMQNKMYGLIQADTCEKYCDSDNGLVDGLTWMHNNFNIKDDTDPANKLTIPTPTTSVGDDFNFIGGDAATLFNGEYLVGYDGNQGTPYRKGNPVAVKDAKNPAPMLALFDYFRYRDGDSDYYDEYGNLVALKDDIWSATVPVYKDSPDVNCETTGSNPVNDIEIVGFADIMVFMPNPPPATNIDVKIDCRFHVIDGRGGGGTFGNLKGKIPNLVK